MPADERGDLLKTAGPGGPSPGLVATERPVPDQPDPTGPSGVGANVDWDSLRRAADEVATHAYAPYSGLRVGAAGLCEDGHLVTGCNVENASFGLTLCAECGLVTALVATGCTRLVAVSVTAGDGRPLTPCGRCRQVLMEHGGPGLLLDGGPSVPPRRLGDLLPGAFDDTELVSRRGHDFQDQPGQRQPRQPDEPEPAGQPGQTRPAGR